MLTNSNHIFFVGIKGVAMANLARIVSKMGKQISGSDVAESFITDKVLAELKIQVINNFEPNDLPENVDLVVYSAAHEGTNNPQVKEAENRGIKTVHQAEFLGELISLFRTSIAIAGCHGKTTTSSLLAYALIKLGVDPSYMVGVSEFTDGSNNYLGGDHRSKEYFVAEADEYAINPPENKTPKFHYLKPDYAFITNIDFDHPDVFSSLQETQNAFSDFINNVKHTLIICKDDPNLPSVIIPKNTKVITYGVHSDADYQIRDLQNGPNGTTFTLKNNAIDTKTFSISLFGEKNVLNAAGVISLLLQLGFSSEEIQNAIKDFQGPKRRFELQYSDGSIYLFDDYAHHPTEIKATIQAARSRFPKSQIIIIFQPHTYSRTQSLQNEFVEALSQADRAIILPIFSSARENKKEFSVSSRTLQELAQEKDIGSIIAVETHEEALQDLESHLQENSVIFTMGAGDVYKMKGEIELRIKN